MTYTSEALCSFNKLEAYQAPGAVLIAGRIKTNLLFLSLQKPESGGRTRDDRTQELGWGRGYSGGSWGRVLGLTLIGGKQDPQRR